MRERQRELEKKYLSETSVKGFLTKLESQKDNQTFLDMCDLIAQGIADLHEKTQRKRAPFFKMTKELEHVDVAFIGMKALFSVMFTCTSSPVVGIGRRLGQELLIAKGEEELTFSTDVKVIKDTAYAGVMLLDTILTSLKSYNLFRGGLVKGSKKNVFSLLPSSGWKALVEENSELFLNIDTKFVPMVCRPDDWKGMRGGGYLTKVAKALKPLVKGKHHHEMPEGDTLFTSVNHMQGTPFRVNQRMYTIYKLLQGTKPKDLKRVFLEELPERYPEPCPLDKKEHAYLWEKEDGIKIDKKTLKERSAKVMVHQDEESMALRKSFFLWEGKRKEHERKVSAKISIGTAFSSCLNLVDALKEFDELFWPQSTDSRCRVYPAAMAGINLQGSDFQKAIVEFSVGLPLDFDGDGEGGVYGIIKTLCNHWGQDSGNGVKTDKLTEKDAVAWANANSDWIVKCANNPLESTEWMKGDKPLQFLAAAFEWAEWLKYFAEHKDYGFISRLCDPNDASCSGAQILSALTRDELGAWYTNLLPDVEAQDLYMRCADKVTETLTQQFLTCTLSQDWLGRKELVGRIEGILKGTEDDLLSLESQCMIREWADTGLELEELFLKVYPLLNDLEKARLSLVIRKLVKTPVMVKFYSGTRYGNIQHCSEFIVGNSLEASFRCEGSGEAASFMGNMIYDSIDQVIKGAGLVMKWFIHVASVFGAHNMPIKSTTPIGFKATMKKVSYTSIRFDAVILGKSRKLSLNVVPEYVYCPVREEDVVCLDTRKMMASISPDLVHMLDASLIVTVAEAAKLEGIMHLLMVHDSLGTHCCYTRRFNRIIRESFVKIFKEDVLSRMYNEFKDQLPDEWKEELLSPEDFGIHYGSFELEEVINSVHCFK